jgi:hypothetical protein
MKMALRRIAGWAVLTVGLGAMVLPTPLAAASDDAPETLGEALKQGEFGLNLRYRFEFVDEDGFDDQGLASTLRTTVHFGSKPWHGVGVFVEMENVADIGFCDQHNDKGQGGRGNEVTDRPVIADPSGTDVYQGYLDFTFIPDSTLRIGRQEIKLGNVRFVGNVGWRQHHQSFDAASLSTKAIPSTTLTYAYVDSVNRIFGDTVDMASHLLQADVEAGDFGTLSVYGFLLDYDEEAFYGLSTNTYGLRYAGGYDFSPSFKGLWDLEYAQQDDAGDNPNRVDADYLRAELGAGFSGWTVTIGHEVLEGEPGNGRFTTPLATLHAWNGWADRFLSTPANGLEDTWLEVSTKVGTVALTGVYHQFEANTGGAEYGSEVDLHAVYATSWKQKLGLKIAAYDADEFSRDVTKVMLWTSWGF